ncbi:Ig-like domain-containing protein, partial [Aurantibacter sp.]|uniref:Ig-like domain-containing protein n=1 Tax=Aurantibacter sp. TaxID=2807103 RepID=UPI003262FF0C
AGGVWSFDLPGVDAQALDAMETITADVSDLAGNPATQATRDIEHDVAAPTITIDVVSGDDVINALEDDSDVTISGTTTGAEDGQTVTVVLDGQTYTTTVTGGVWSFDLPATAAQALGATETITADVSDAAGNPATQATRDIEHDVTAPTITIDVVSGDDIISAVEDDSDVTISGTTTDAEDGQTVTVVLNGQTYTTTVTSGTWSFDLPAADAQALDPLETITADVSDAAGNPAAQATRDIIHDDSAPVITIDVVSIDDIINEFEQNSDVTISGTTDAEDGQTVTVTLNGQTYTTTVTGGTWSLDVPAVDVQALDPNETITADVNDLAGNPATQATRDIEHDVTAPVITIDVVAVDDIINSIEDDNDVTISGTTDAEDGQVVTVILNGQTYTAIVTGGTWSFDLPAADAQALDATETIAADVSDVAGNPAIEATRDIEHDAAAPTIAIDVVSTDDIINAVEDDSDVTISGTTDAEDGQIVTVVLNGETYTTAVTGGTWSLDVPASDAQALNANETITANVNDVSGNPAIEATRDIEHDVTAPTISINVVATDDIINALEDDSDVTFNGSTDAEDGQTVTVTLNGQTYTTLVNGGTWSLDLPAADAQALDANETITADVSNVAGNPAIQATRDIEHDVTPPIITIDVVSNDDVISGVEDDNDVIISGTTDAEDGQTVTVTLNGQTYTTTVTGGVWSLGVPAADAQALDVNETITADVSDLAGNPATQVTRDIVHDVIIDIEINTPIEIDNIVSEAEVADVIISGVTTGVEDNQTVTVTLDDGVNSVTTTATVTGGTWTANEVDISGLNNGPISVNAEVSDLAGNTADDTESIVLNTTAPIADSFSTSDITPVVTGQGDANESLLVELDTNGDNSVDVTYSVIADANGDWSIDTGSTTPDSGSLPVLSDEDVIQVIVTDEAGNTGTGTVTISEDTDNDGLTNNEEAALGTDTNNPDTDGDGINDGQEVNIDTTDPLDDCDHVNGTPLSTSDCDNDDLTTEEEATLGTDPNNPDTDNDGLTDSEEVDLGTAPLNPDSDGDGIIDGQEVLDNTNPLDACDSIGGTPVGTSDCDEDGLTTDEENALGTDPENEDTDGDTIIDGQEITDQTDPLDSCDSIGGSAVDGVACDIEIENDLISPDLNNGIFKIKFIEQFPENTVEIYNRWGIKVFETNGYNNDSNAFSGISSARVTIQEKEELPVGVYFYIIKYMKNTNGMTKSGYLYVNR